MQSFKTYHPLVNFTYFVAVIGVTMFCMHPVLLGISVVSGFAHAWVLFGKRAFRTCLYLIPLCIVAVLFNVLLNHRGETILTYFPSGNPLTLESVLYGLAAAVMLCAVVLHFSCFTAIMTSDKLHCLTGRLFPSLSLIFSMTLRFVPHLTNRIQKVRMAQRGIGEGDGNSLRRLRQAITALSVTLDWSLENAVDTADSMRARGHGLPGRTTFSLYTFDRYNRGLLFIILLLGGVVIGSGIAGKIRFFYYPALSGNTAPLAYAAYGVLCFLPILIEIREVFRWKYLQSKI